jgi:hypothetical protein
LIIYLITIIKPPYKQALIGVGQRKKKEKHQCLLGLSPAGMGVGMLKSTCGLPMQIPKISILFISERPVIRHV